MIGWILGALGVAVGALFLKDGINEINRKSTPCDYTECISQEFFCSLVRQATKHIKRITNWYVDGPVVKMNVRSQSGITDWTFTVDFNDHGNITGAYWLSKDNADSRIPERVASFMSEAIKQRIVEYNELNQDQTPNEKPKECKEEKA